MVEKGPFFTSPESAKKLERVGTYYVQDTHIPKVRVRTSSPYVTPIPEGVVELLYSLGKRHERTKGIIHRASGNEKRIKQDLRSLQQRYPLLRGIESSIENENFYLNISPVREWNEKLLMRVMGARFFSIISGDVRYTIAYPVGTFRSREEMEMKKRDLINIVSKQDKLPLEDAENMVSYQMDVTIDPDRFREVAKELRGRLRFPRRVRTLKSRVIKSDRINKGLTTLSEITKRTSKSS